MNKYFVTGIGTDIGKTFISAILVEALQADYWKPIQAGELENSDTHKVQNLISNSVSKFHEENYKLTTPASPHYSAEIDQIEIDINKIVLPETPNNLIIEGAGGLMVPINSTQFVIDIIKKLDVEVILVSKNYLGSINHTILTYEVLKQHHIKIKGIIFNGTPNKASEDFILNYTKLDLIGNVLQESEITKEVVLKYAEIFKTKF
ncbi:MAG: dethiobiotin synthase [Bacteroidetes bacterium]|nr:dethiobiotin synthase [Bacteroidota bacterium]